MSMIYRTKYIKKQYGTKRDLLSAFYQLWMMPGISNACVEGAPLSYTQGTDIRILKGMEEIPFCLFLERLPLSEVFFLWGTDSDSRVSARADLKDNALEITFHNDAGFLYQKVRTEIKRFHSTRIFPAPDTVIPHFSLQHHEDPNLAMDSLIRWLHASPVLEGKIMTAKDTLKVCKPYAKDKKKIIAVYAYSKMQQAFVAYDTFNDILVKNNFTP